MRVEQVPCGYNMTNCKPEKEARKQASSQHHQIYRMFVDLDKACSRLVTCEQTKVIRCLQKQAATLVGDILTFSYAKPTYNIPAMVLAQY